MNKKTVIAGAVLITIAIVLGAFGAHALRDRLNEAQLSSFETGVRYQIYQGLALLILGIGSAKFKFNLKPISSLILIGTIMFSLSIYGLSLQSVLGMKLGFLGPVTPFGGLLMIIGWTVFIVQLMKQKDA